MKILLSFLLVLVADVFAESSVMTYEFDWKVVDSTRPTLYNGPIRGKKDGCYFKCVENLKCVLSVYNLVTDICKVYALVPNLDLVRITKPKKAATGNYETVVEIRYEKGKAIANNQVHNVEGMKYKFIRTDNLIQVKKV